MFFEISVILGYSDDLPATFGYPVKTVNRCTGTRINAAVQGFVSPSRVFFPNRLWITVANFHNLPFGRQLFEILLSISRKITAAELARIFTHAFHFKPPIKFCLNHRTGHIPHFQAFHFCIGL